MDATRSWGETTSTQKDQNKKNTLNPIHSHISCASAKPFKARNAQDARRIRQLQAPLRADFPNGNQIHRLGPRGPWDRRSYQDGGAETMAAAEADRGP